MSIEKAYELIKKSVEQCTQIDSLEVVKQVEQYRQFWKPPKTNVALLAESHVHTNEQDFKTECKRPMLDIFVPNYPTRYVRFVYCLGYGENELLTRKVEDNPGTYQYWKIFSSCAAESENDLGFQEILKTGTPSLPQRLKNKTNVLRKMQEKGVWLLDASIVGIYRAIKDHKAKERIIEICWDNHLKNVIFESNPKHIIVIGKGVVGILGSRLDELGISSTALPQPQGDRGSSQEQLENYKEYQRICSKYSYKQHALCP